MISKEKTNYLYKYDNKIYWNVGVIYNHLFNFKNLINMLKYYNIDIPISFIHGSWLSKFNGGRFSALQLSTEDEIKNDVKFFNDNNIGIKLTFSRDDYTEKDFDDPEMRFYLDTLAENPNVRNGIICQMDKFAEFLKKEYPMLEITASYCKHEFETRPGYTDTSDYYNKLFDLYDIVVINSTKAFNDEFLSEIKYPGRVEFIVNHLCAPNCQIAKKHHTLAANKGLCEYYINKDINKKYYVQKFQDLIKENEEIDEKCILQHYHCKILDQQFINKEEVNYLSNLGFNIFKIEGRDRGWSWFLYSFINYIINQDSNFINIVYQYINKFSLDENGKYIMNNNIRLQNIRENTFEPAFLL